MNTYVSFTRDSVSLVNPGSDATRYDDFKLPISGVYLNTEYVLSRP